MPSSGRRAASSTRPRTRPSASESNAAAPRWRSSTWTARPGSAGGRPRPSARTTRSPGATGSPSAASSGAPTSAPARTSRSTSSAPASTSRRCCTKSPSARTTTPSVSCRHPSPTCRWPGTWTRPRRSACTAPPRRHPSWRRCSPGISTAPAGSAAGCRRTFSASPNWSRSAPTSTWATMPWIMPATWPPGPPTGCAPTRSGAGSSPPAAACPGCGPPSIPTRSRAWPFSPAPAGPCWPTTWAWARPCRPSPRPPGCASTRGCGGCWSSARPRSSTSGRGRSSGSPGWPRRSSRDRRRSGVSSTGATPPATSSTTNSSCATWRCSTRPCARTW